MASNKAKIRNAQAGADLHLGRVLIKIVAVGFAGGVALIGSAKALGEKLEDKHVKDFEKREAEREAAKEDVRRIMKNSVEAEYDSGENISER
ncbi:MAG: hypothetical protein J5961_00580 [Mogibacterium sp.]|nr:hypothetical protein [Mogibacterium sp.]